MPSFSSFALQFTGFTAASLSATAADLLIVEAGVTSTSGQASLTATELGQLAAEGRKVIGYVNTSVTDHNRAYWQTGWISPSGDEPDVGVVSPTAPAWLKNNLGTVDFDAAHPGPEATLVDYRDPDWRAHVIAQAVAVVQAGFHGVFLDDVARYYEAAQAGGGFDGTLADSMMALVIEVAAAVRAVNPDAVVVVNSGVYIGGDSAAGTASQLFADYKAAIDGVLIENQYASEVDPAPPNVLSDAQANFAGIDILALENAASGLDRMGFLAFAATKGLLPYVSPNEGYGQFATAPQIDWDGVHYLAGSPLQSNVLFGLGGADILQGGAGADTALGGIGNDQLLGLGGADLLQGEDGDDTVAGGEGSDRLYGGAGRDSLAGEAGDDRAYGGAGNDSLNGGTDNDRLYGDAGNDQMRGDAGADQLSGGAGDDRLYGGATTDFLIGGLDNDRLYGGLGNDRLTGDAGADSLAGEAGNDRLYGGAGNDRLYGGADSDRIDGGAGNDLLTGGLGGRDVFVFTADAGRDVIADFDNVGDRIDLRSYTATSAELRAAIRDWSGGVTIDLARLGGEGAVRLLDHDGQVIALSLSDFLI